MVASALAPRNFRQLRHHVARPVQLSTCARLYTFFRPIMDNGFIEFGINATNFDSSHDESFPNGRRNAEPPKLPALFPNCMH